jgi:hypothetical protein
VQWSLAVLRSRSVTLGHVVDRGFVGTGVAGGPAVATRGPEARVASGVLQTAQQMAERPRQQYLRSALAWWDYNTKSVELIFADRTGNADADCIKAEMLPGDSLSFGEIRKQIFSNHITAGRLRDALRLLKSSGDVRVHVEETPGRSRRVVERLGHPPEHTGARLRAAARCH